MPLVIITGIPSSGKTTTALRLKAFIEETKGCPVHLVSENAILRSEGDENDVLKDNNDISSNKKDVLKDQNDISSNKNDVLNDSKREKMIRGALKSESIRLLTKDSVVICDGLNYIKGE
jgi:protein KTI12